MPTNEQRQGELTKDVMMRVAHDLQGPLVGLRATLERMRWECDKIAVRFEFDYFKELEAYVSEAVRWSQVVYTLTGLHYGVRERARPADIASEIVGPCLESLYPVLTRHNLSDRDIRVRGFRQLPPVHVDRDLLSLALYNVLDNAIKYSNAPGRRTDIQVEGRVSESGYEIIVRDFGPGIPDKAGDDIFRLGARPLDMWDRMVLKAGLGLWCARRILELHGGTTEIRSCRNPTEVVLILPRSLGLDAPSGERAGRR
ncbi:MAG: sensor histidine kinase [Phycisphaerales bacterium]|nr:MAG: sensor histidine kinase [Phycisphaerales bacterium]